MLVDVSAFSVGFNDKSYDYYGEVLPKGARRWSHAQGGTTRLLETDNEYATLKRHGKTYRQITSVHEFGHLIGLDHPNFGLGSHESGDREDYDTPEDGVDFAGREVDTGDLMGRGMGLRKFYFDAWKTYANQNVPCAPWDYK